MKSWPRSILRLSGRPPKPAPERKSEPPPAAVFRRFFATLARLDRRARTEPRPEPREPA
jgi:hypothetical protein